MQKSVIHSTKNSLDFSGKQLQKLSKNEKNMLNFLEQKFERRITKLEHKTSWQSWLTKICGILILRRVDYLLVFILGLVTGWIITLLFR